MVYSCKQTYVNKLRGWNKRFSQHSELIIQYLQNSNVNGMDLMECWLEKKSGQQMVGLLICKFMSIDIREQKTRFYCESGFLKYITVLNTSKCTLWTDFSSYWVFVKCWLWFFLVENHQQLLPSVYHNKMSLSA